MPERTAADETSARPLKRRGRPKSQDAAFIERDLLAIGLQEFVTHGYGLASMHKIAGKAGVSKTTLYARFPSKELLLRAILDDHIQRLGNLEISINRESPGTLEEGLRDFAFRLVSEDPDDEFVAVRKLIFSDSYRMPILGEFGALRAGFVAKQVADFIRYRAAIDGIPCKDPDKVAEVYTFAMAGWLLNVVQANRDVEESERVEWVDRTVKLLLAARADW